MPVRISQDTLTGGLLMQLRNLKSHRKRECIKQQASGSCKLAAYADGAWPQLPNQG